MNNQTEPKIVGTCEYNKCQQILTDDYQVFKDCEGNLFCSEECVLKYYGVEELDREEIEWN